jgi:hypothetical protein
MVTMSVALPRDLKITVDRVIVEYGISYEDLFRMALNLWLGQHPDPDGERW